MNDRTNALAPLMEQEELIDVLMSSIFPGASRQSAALVIGYCKATGMDPMLKPCHIVPLRVKTGQKDRYGNDEHAMRDTIMPGIGLYRIQAARTGEYAGQDEAKFGPTKTLAYQQKKTEWVEVPGRDKKQPKHTFVEAVLEYPEWCSVTIYRLVGGFRSAFTAIEYWTENYATAGRDSDAPNEMWARRTRAQLAKCAEAQALRKAFPEVGQAPTADEMEGRTYDDEPKSALEFTAPAKVTPQRASAKAAAEDATIIESPAPSGNSPSAAAIEETSAPAAPAPAEAPAPTPAAEVKGEPASEGEKKNALITAKAKGKNIAALLAELGFALDPNTLEGLTKPMFKAIKGALS